MTHLETHQRVARWVVTAQTRIDHVDLAPGVVLEHLSTEETYQGCAGCENHIVWSRYRVMSGPAVGSLVEPYEIDPKPYGVARQIVPDWMRPL